MAPGPEKHKLLEILIKQNRLLTLSELLDILGSSYKERTTRRWLNELVTDGLVLKHGKKKATKYESALKEDDKKRSNKSFSLDSQAILSYLKKPLYQREPCSYRKEWLSSYKPNSSFYLPREMRDRLKKFGTRSDKADPAGTYAHKIYNRLLIDLSYNSSRLEGNTYTLLDTEKLILSGGGAKGKLDKEKVMILNHKEAIRYLVENAPRLKLEVNTICTLHYLLSYDLIEPKDSGSIRDHWVRITGSTYIPLENPEEIAKILKQIVKTASEIKDPFETSFFLLVHLSYLQAFSDVNKRSARLACNIPLIIKNLVPLSFNGINRSDYMQATIAVYEMQEVGPLSELFSYSYLDSCQIYDNTIKEIQFDEVRVRYRSERREIFREVIINLLTGEKQRFYVEKRSKELVPRKDQTAFILKVVEDLSLMSEAKIAGLGVTSSQFKKWHNLQV